MFKAGDKVRYIKEGELKYGFIYTIAGENSLVGNWNIKENSTFKPLTKNLELVKEKEMSMHKIIKFDPEKTTRGMKVFDILDGWITVKTILSDEWDNALNCSNNLQYGKDGKFRSYQRPSLVAMKIPLKVEDIKDIKRSDNPYMFDILNHAHLLHEVNGNYYTEENAKIVKRILNK